MNQINYLVKQYSEIKVEELAKLSTEVWNARGNEITTERFANWLQNLEFTIEPQIVLAYRRNNLIGWSMLFAHSKTELELNPFALGGHPIIAFSENREEITTHLLRKSIKYFQQSDYTRIDLSFNEEKTKQEQQLKKLYEQSNFVLTEQICHMRLNLVNFQLCNPNTESRIATQPISQVDKEQFYECLYATFRETEDRWVQSLSDEELRDFFENRILNISFKLIDECSIGLFEQKELIGFSVVRESHGQKNGHLWIMGVHPNHRKKGFGTILLDTMLSGLKNKNYESASLNVDLTNEPAVNLYQKKGFKKDWVQLAYAFKKE